MIATKCFFPVYDSPEALKNFANFADDPELINRVGLSRKHIFDAVEGSLKRLGVDYIDLYQIHRLDTVSILARLSISHTIRLQH